MKALFGAKLALPALCEDSSSSCVGFQPGEAMANAATTVLKFNCGTKALGDVTSVLTEDRKATVRYTRVVKVDEQLTTALSACKLTTPKAGPEEKEMQFIRNDDGAWMPAK